MATETYTVVYLADATAFVGGVHKVEQAVISFDTLVTQNKKNTASMFGGAGRSATSAAKNIEKLNAAMGRTVGAANAAASATNNAAKAFNNAGAASKSLSTAIDTKIAKIAALAVAWKVAAAAVNIYTKASEDAKQHLNTGAQTGLDKRVKSREFAKLMDENDPNDKVIGQLHDIQLAGGMKFDKALEFGSAVLGSTKAGKDKGFITTDIQTAMLPKLAEFASAYGMDEATAGVMAGGIAQYVDLTGGKGKDAKLSSKEIDAGVNLMMGQMGASVVALNDGVGDVSTLATALTKSMAPALATGHVADPAETAAFINVASTLGPAAGAATAFDQFDRLINKPNKEGGEFLKTIGVADEKGNLAKTRKLKEYVDAQRAASPDPTNFDEKGLLINKGFGNVREVDRAIGFMNNMPVLEAQVAKAKDNKLVGTRVQAQNDQFRASVTGQEQSGEAFDEVGLDIQTERRQRLVAARKAARGQLRAEKKINEFDTNLTAGFMDATINKLHTNNEDEARIDQRAWENTRKAATKAGIVNQVEAVDKRFMGDIMSPAIYGEGMGANIPAYGGQDPGKLDEFLNRFGPAIEGKRVSISDQGGSVIRANVDNAMAGVPRVGGANAGIKPEALIKANQGPAGGQAELVGPPMAGAGAAGGGAAGGAAGVAAGGGKVASVDASSLEKGSEKLAMAAGRLERAVQKMMGSPGSHLGDGYDPYRA